MSKLISVLKFEPSVVMYALNALLTALVAFGVHASPGQTAAITTIVAAVITIVTAASTRPVAVPLITGAGATIATAAAAFGLHLTSAQIGAAVPLAAVILSLVLRQAVTPVATLAAQKRAAEAQRAHP